MKVGTYIASLVQPLLAKVLMSLGFSVVTIIGVEAIFTQLRNQLQTSFGGLPADMLNLFLLAGGGTGMGMILGAITTRLMLWQIQRSTQILGRNPG